MNRKFNVALFPTDNKSPTTFGDKIMRGYPSHKEFLEWQVLDPRDFSEGPALMNMAWIKNDFMMLVSSHIYHNPKRVMFVGEGFRYENFGSSPTAGEDSFSCYGSESLQALQIREILNVVKGIDYVTSHSNPRHQNKQTFSVSDAHGAYVLNRIPENLNSADPAVNFFFTYDSLFLVNWTQKVYIDMAAYIKRNLKGATKQCVHPLAILTACGNEYCDGGYRGINQKFAGDWAFDKLSLEKDFPNQPDKQEFDEFIIDFLYNRKEV